MCLPRLAMLRFRADLTAVAVGIALLLVGVGAVAAPAAGRQVRVLEASLASAISPAQADMLEAALNRARDSGADMLLVRLDTPGGSIEVMRRMVMTILNAPVPVVIWVAPSGARAASAGVFWRRPPPIWPWPPRPPSVRPRRSASAVATSKGTLKTKIKNDLLSLLRGMAERYGRNADWYARAVTVAANLDAMEAVRLRVADMIAVDKSDLMDQLGRRGVATDRGLLHFAAGDVRFEPFEPGLRHDLLSWLLDPSVAYILLLAGLAGLYFEIGPTPGVIARCVRPLVCSFPCTPCRCCRPTPPGCCCSFWAGCFFGWRCIYSYGLLGLAGGASFLWRCSFRGAVSGPCTLPILPTVAGLSLFLGLIGWLLPGPAAAPKSGVEA